MGSVTVIFIAPIMMIVMLFGSLFGFLTGNDKTEVELPYNPEKGLVWEYDGVNAPLFDLVETKIEGDKQVFVFKGKDSRDIPDDVKTWQIMEVIFTDENGNERIYYAKKDDGYLMFQIKIAMFPIEDCVIYEYTAKAKEPVENGKWVWKSETTEKMLMETKVINGSEKKYTFLEIPEHGDDTDFKTDWTTTDEFWYYSGNDRLLESVDVTFELKDGKAVVKNEDQRILD